MELLPLHVGPAFDPHRLIPHLAAALAGEGPAVAPYAGDPADGFALQALAAAEPATERAEDIAVVISTSGSTGTPKHTMLSVDALAASAMGTAMALHGEGQWLLTLPVHYVAGLQVLVRSLYAGTRPWVMDSSDGFTAEAFTAAAGELTDRIRMTSLVPTQLQRLLADPTPETVGVLRRFNAILVGGAPLSEGLRAEARRQGLNIVSTYGMTETCGGCVYDGVPLEGVQVRSDGGRLWLGGDVLAAGYLGDPDRTEASFRVEDGERWYRTEDLGEVNDGVVTVQGRSDDVINTGGVKVSAGAVTRALEGVAGVEAAAVVGIPDPEWGEQVAAAVVGTAAPQELRDRVRAELGAEAVPRVLVSVTELPLLASGKTDRVRLAAMLSANPDSL